MGGEDDGSVTDIDFTRLSRPLPPSLDVCLRPLNDRPNVVGTTLSLDSSELISCNDELHHAMVDSEDITGPLVVVEGNSIDVSCSCRSCWCLMNEVTIREVASHTLSMKIGRSSSN